MLIDKMMSYIESYGYGSVAVLRHEYGIYVDC